MNKIDQSILLDIDHCPLEKVAQMAGCDVRTLIHLGGAKKLKVHTYARQWETHIIEFGKDEDGKPTGEVRVQTMTLDHIQDELVRIPWHEMKGWDAFWEDQTEFQLSGVDYVQYSLEDPSVEEAVFPATFNEPLIVKLPQLLIKTADIRSLLGLSSSTAKEDQKPDGGVSRDTLLTMIIGMAVDAYGYDPGAKKSHVPKELENCFNLLGLSLIDDTIRKALKEASVLLPAKPHKS